CAPEQGMKWLPLTVRVNAAPPATAVLGDRLVSNGAGLFVVIVNVRALDGPPPGAGLTTVTGGVPATAMSLAAIAAVTWPVFTKVVVRGEPFHCTTELEMKLLPFTVKMTADPPATALLLARL